MFRHLKAWWYILNAAAGTVARAGRQIDYYFRYYVLKNLDEIGFFRYLEEPRTYGQILTQMKFDDNKFTRELLQVLAADKKNLIIAENGNYRRNPDVPLPTLKDLVKATDKKFHNFTMLAEGMASNVVPKLQNKTIAFTSTFEAEGRMFLSKFDALLAANVYSLSRKAAISLLTKEEREWLRGKTMLEVGCGSGRETSELWHHFDGEVKITATDPVDSMLELAQQQFEIHVKELDPAHPPITEDNRPIFKRASATQLPFEDNSFDAVFMLFMLHWTPDPRKAISEIVRVLKPGGVILGGQPFKPEANEYFDVTLRTNDNCYGFFWREDFYGWFAEHDLKVDMFSPVGIFYVKNIPIAIQEHVL